MLRSRLADARGSALVPALLIMSLLLAFGAASLSLADGDQRDSRRERERESSFQLAEGVLNAAIYRLSTRWPGQADAPYPSACTAGSLEADCPGGTSLQANFSGPDYNRPNAWKVQVRDNSDGAQKNFYAESLMSSTVYNDANGDNFLWVRAEATVAGRKRVLVALVEAENVLLNFPNAAVVAGKFETTNKGAKVIIDTNGYDNTATNGDVIVRCDLAAPDCAKYEHSGNKQQVDPPTVKSVPEQPKAVSPEALEQLRTRAKAEGNYHTGCPPEIKAGDASGGVPPGELQGRNGPGGLVFIEDAEGCKFNGNNVYNSPTKPGYLVIAKGAATFNGTADFYGVMYHANEDERSDMLLNLTGNILVHGAIVIDGQGGLSAGSSKMNLVYDPNVFAGLQAFGTAGLVQNTFREIKGA
jgi:Tfp pilus assembly protein PilX